MEEEKYIKEILNLLSGKVNNFYLVGGTALSLFYLRHRYSFDIDFFTNDFDFKKIEGILNCLKERFYLKILQRFEKEGMAKILLCEIKYKGKKIKIDFVEDFFKFINPVNIINGIPVASLEDIYLRKIYSICGFWKKDDITGKREIIGGREEGKNIFDLYFLSSTFTPLSEFVYKYCDRVIIENLVIWFRKYDRFKIKSEISDLKTEHKIDYYKIERHFKEEIDKIIEKEVDFI
jgi:hypothetical protein